MADPLLSRAQAADRLGVSLSTVERLLADGELPSVHVRGRVLIDPRDLRAYVERHRRGGGDRAAEWPPTRMYAAFGARTDALDRLDNEAAGTWHRAALVRAGEQFGRQISSAKELSYDEMSWVLDMLRDERARR